MINLVLANLKFEIGNKNIFLKRFDITKEDTNHIPFHWKNKKKFIKDNEYLKKFYERFLKYLSRNLNQIHKLNYTNNDWRIIIGPWLWRLIGHYFDRFECLNSVTKKVCINEINTSFFKPSPNHYQDFIKIMRSKEWNYYVTLEIAKKLDNKKIFFKKKGIKLQNKSKKKDKSKFKYERLLNLFKDNDTFIQAIGLDKLNLIKLFFKLKVIPHKIYDFEKNIISKKLFSKRKKLFFKFKSKNLFEEIISSNIHKYIPANFYEHFKENVERAKKISYFPKKIITSQLHLNSDLFKIWMTLKKYKSKKLIIIRHGGSDVNLEHFEIIHEKKISHKYLSIKTNSKKAVNCSRPFLIKKFISKKNLKKILLVDIERPLFNDLIIGPSSNDMKKKYEGTLSLCKKIIENKKLKKNFRIIPYRNVGYNFYKEYKKKIEDKFLAKPMTLDSEIKNSKLIICRYPLTAYLKCLYNRPTILYLTNEWYFNKRFLKKIPQLKKNNLFFDDEKKLLKHLEKISSDPFKWWNKDSIKKCLKNSFNFIPEKNDLDDLANEIEKI